MAKASKETRIKNERSRLLEIFKMLDANKLNTSMALIDRAAFLTVSIQDLEEQLNEHGWTEAYKNGENQHGMKKSAAADCHISLTKNLTSIIKQLTELAPAAQAKSRLSELMSR